MTKLMKQWFYFACYAIPAVLLYRGMSVISFEITPLLLTERYREWEKPDFYTDFSQRSNKIHEKSKKAHVVQEGPSQHRANKMCSRYFYELLNQKIGSPH